MEAVVLMFHTFAGDISEAPQSPFWTGCPATTTSICKDRINVRNRKELVIMHTNNLFPKNHGFKVSQCFNIQAVQNKVFRFNSTDYKFLNIPKGASLENIHCPGRQEEVLAFPIKMQFWVLFCFQAKWDLTNTEVNRNSVTHDDFLP